MTKIEKIEKKAMARGLDISIAPANSWISSMGKGKWAYSLYIKGSGIYEPTVAFSSLKDLEADIENH